MQNQKNKSLQTFVVLNVHKKTNENDIRTNEYRVNDKKNEKVKMSTNGTTGKSRKPK